MSITAIKSSVTDFVKQILFTRKNRNKRHRGGNRNSGISSRKPGNAEPLPEMMLRSLPGYIFSLDKTGVWQSITPGNCEYFKSIESENFVQWVNEAVHVQDRVAILKAVSDCRAEDRETSAEFRLLNHNQTSEIPKWIEIRCASIPISDTILTTLHNISSRKELEEEIIETCNCANRENISKSEFLATMSHELRTPLNAIIGFSDILKNGMISTCEVEKYKEYNGFINDSAQHLLQILNDILDMSKIESGKYDIQPENIELMQIIQSCCSILMPLAKKVGVDIHIENLQETLLLNADSRAIQQILFNLLSNAIKFTKTGTRITVSAIRIGRKVEITIQDRGNGIPIHCLEALGEPFYQADNKKSRQHEGAGLGLSIVKGLVELHHGKLYINNRIGVGVAVTVSLPQSQDNVHPVPANNADVIIKINANTMPEQPSLSSLVG